MLQELTNYETDVKICESASNTCENEVDTQPNLSDPWPIASNVQGFFTPNDVKRIRQAFNDSAYMQHDAGVAQTHPNAVRKKGIQGFTGVGTPSPADIYLLAQAARSARDRQSVEYSNDGSFTTGEGKNEGRAALLRSQFAAQRFEKSQSDATFSYNSSLEYFLELQEPDPEQLLLQLGFGGPPEGIDRIPDRFLQRSQVYGIDIDVFFRMQQEIAETVESGSLGYRGLSGPPTRRPSTIVARILDKIKENQREDQKRKQSSPVNTNISIVKNELLSVSEETQVDRQVVEVEEDGSSFQYLGCNIPSSQGSRKSSLRRQGHIDDERSERNSLEREPRDLTNGDETFADELGMEDSVNCDISFADLDVKETANYVARLTIELKSTELETTNCVERPVTDFEAKDTTNYVKLPVDEFASEDSIGYVIETPAVEFHTDKASNECCNLIRSSSAQSDSSGFHDGEAAAISEAMQSVSAVHIIETPHAVIPTLVESLIDENEKRVDQPDPTFSILQLAIEMYRNQLDLSDPIESCNIMFESTHPRDWNHNRLKDIEELASIKKDIHNELLKTEHLLQVYQDRLSQRSDSTNTQSASNSPTFQSVLKDMTILLREQKNLNQRIGDYRRGALMYRIPEAEETLSLEKSPSQPIASHSTLKDNSSPKANSMHFSLEQWLNNFERRLTVQIRQTVRKEIRKALCTRLKPNKF